MGIIAFSTKKNCITWFGVCERYRRRGVGSSLLTCAINQLDHDKEIKVPTFRDTHTHAQAARGIYAKFGFTVTDNNFFQDNQPRCLMTITPGTLGPKKASFHHNYQRYQNRKKPEYCPVCNNMEGPADIVLIHEFEHSWLEASIKAQGRLWGKCLLLSKKHCVELCEMPKADLDNSMADVQVAAGALKKVTMAERIIYELYGNSMPHMHMHLFPRYIDDDFPGSPIGYSRIEPSPYSGTKEFDDFLKRMRDEIGK